MFISSAPFKSAIMSGRRRQLAKANRKVPSQDLGCLLQRKPKTEKDLILESAVLSSSSVSASEDTQFPEVFSHVEETPVPEVFPHVEETQVQKELTQKEEISSEVFPEKEETSSAVLKKKGRPPKETMVDHFFGTKQLYNSFAYKLTKQSAETKSKYNKLLQKWKAGDGTIDEVMQDLIQKVIESKGPIIQRKRKRIETNVKDTEEGWVSWEVAKTIEGEKILLELVESGAVPARKHIKLPANTKIPYPDHLQVFISAEKSKKNAKARRMRTRLLKRRKQMMRTITKSS